MSNFQFYFNYDVFVFNEPQGSIISLQWCTGYYLLQVWHVDKGSNRVSEKDRQKSSHQQPAPEDLKKN